MLSNLILLPDHVPDHEPASQPALGELVAHARAEGKRASAIFAAVLAAALLAAALAAPSYRATATLAVLPSPEFTVRPAAGSQPGMANALAMDEIMQAETEILQSDTLHDAALQTAGPAALYPAIFGAPPGPFIRTVKSALHLLMSPWRTAPKDEAADRQQNALKQFAHDLKVLPEKESNVINLSFTNHDATAAANALNALLAQYAKRRASLYQDPQIAIVRQQAGDSAARLAAAEHALAAFKTSNNISDDDQQRTLLLNRRNLAEQAQADALAAVRENQARLDALASQIKAEPASIGLYDEQDSDFRLQAVNAALADLRGKLAAAREKYRDDSHVVIGLEAQIASNEADARRLANAAAQSVVRTGRNPNLDPLHLDRARAAADLAAARARAAAQAQEQTNLSATLARMDSIDAALTSLQRDRDTALDAYRSQSRILTERHLTEAEDTQRLANVRVIQPAIPPQRPRPTPMLILAAGFALGVIAACAWIVISFVTSPVLYTAGGVEAATGLLVLAVFAKPSGEYLFIDD